MPARSPFSYRSLGLFLAASLLATGVFIAATPAAPEPARPTTKPVDPEVARARREVKLLDAVYKDAIILITKNYVTEKSEMPAGTAFKALFADMKKQGWHEVRLLDATGEPLNDDNAPRDAFEKSAVKALLAGKPYYEELTVKDGKRYLRAATPIPIALDKCKMCHDNFHNQKVIGALGYTLPLDDKTPRK